VVRGGDFENAGETSAGVTAILKDLEIDPDIILRVGVVTFEAEMNVVLYARKGSMELRVTPKDIRITVEDEGDGIPDLELAMQEGYSTASEEIREMGFGAGMGLPNIKRNANAFTINSVVGKGTTLEITIEA